MQPLATRALRLGIHETRFAPATLDPISMGRVSGHILDGLDYWQARGAHVPPRLHVKPIKQITRGCETAAYLIPYAEPILHIDPRFYWKRLADGRYGREHVSAPYGIVLHEIGHFSHWRHTGGDGGDYLEIAELPPLPRRHHKTARHVSERATEHPCEFVAECFVGLSVGRRYPAPVLELYHAFGGPEPLTGWPDCQV